MRNKILIPGIIIVVLGIFFSFRYGSNNDVVPEEEKKTILQTVVGILNEAHYAPRDINDAFSKKVFDKTLESLDYDKKFFLAEDISQLSVYEKELDDQIKTNSLAFFDAVNNLFVQRVDEAEKYYKSQLDQAFTFSKEDSIQLNGEQLEWAANEQELASRWHKNLKYRVLSKYVDLKETQEKKLKDSANYKAKTPAELEEEARKSVAKGQERYFKRLKKLNDNDRFALYVNSITGAEDPHTNYLMPDDKKRFDEMMSGSFYGIGAQLQQQEDGNVKITAIITGSPSWKQGKLRVEDVITQVAQGDEMPVDVEGFDIEDVVKMIRGPKDTEVRLTVKHADGSNETISILRGKVDIEDTFAKSAIIKNDDKKIGYIYLPEFYADFNGQNGGRRSGTDVANEVIKLMEEKVDGIVLDLRNNGGGSLTDVVDMVGIFIGTGPVVQVRGSGNQTITLKSKNKAPLYTGPLTVMVNGGSASASEILAAALQDYGRAVIVGSNTFGKGTVQKLVTLDPFVNGALRNQIIQAFNKAKGGEAEYDGIGSLKLTIQKFYRINGGSTQLKGVTPDILLPDAYDKLENIGEGKESSALPWDKISSVDYSLWNARHALPDLRVLKSKSQERVNNNPTFDIIAQTSERLKERQDNYVVPLSEKAFVAKQKESEAINKKLEDIEASGDPILVTNLKSDLSRINIDTASKSKNETWLKALKKDVYIAESTNILNDWINADKRILRMSTVEN